MQSFKNINFFLRLSDGNVHREGGIPPEPPNISYTLPLLVYLCFYVGGWPSSGQWHIGKFCRALLRENLPLCQPSWDYKGGANPLRPQNGKRRNLGLSPSCWAVKLIDLASGPLLKFSLCDIINRLVRATILHNFRGNDSHPNNTVVLDLTV